MTIDNTELSDIYFEEKYGKLCEYIEDGVSEKYVFENENGKISNLFIKREIKDKLDGKTYYDITTPYGYGGPIIERLDGDEKELVQNFNDEFTKYCLDNSIVSEFVRFHPIIGNHKYFENMYEVVYMRDTVATHLSEDQDFMYDEYSKSVRKNINRLLRGECKSEVIHSPNNIDQFIEIYYDTMDRNNAKDFYYFDKEYFDYLLTNFRSNILNVNIYFEDQCIASGIYFVYNKIMQAHLSGTKAEFLKMSPAYLLRYHASKWAQENGIKYFHHGGGTTNSKDDGLLRFKQRFSKRDNFKFYIGKKIYNKEAYDKLVEITKNSDNESDYFPKYRA